MLGECIFPPPHNKTPAGYQEKRKIKKREAAEFWTFDEDQPISSFTVSSIHACAYILVSFISYMSLNGHRGCESVSEALYWLRDTALVPGSLLPPCHTLKDRLWSSGLTRAAICVRGGPIDRQKIPGQACLAPTPLAPHNSCHLSAVLRKASMVRHLSPFWGENLYCLWIQTVGDQQGRKSVSGGSWDPTRLRSVATTLMKSELLWAHSAACFQGFLQVFLLTICQEVTFSCTNLSCCVFVMPVNWKTH